jgi:hypothetical protein
LIELSKVQVAAAQLAVVDDSHHVIFECFLIQHPSKPPMQTSPPETSWLKQSPLKTFIPLSFLKTFGGTKLPHHVRA